ncbi:MAG: GNAT family N-acetyltransferase [Xanthomonadales bacterium]|nr:GNAT family N-acetyltransferase [Xanthomonadales bacterium]
MMRVAVAGDIPAMQRIRASVRENRLVSRTISDEEVRAAITQPGRGWVIETDGSIVAFGIANHQSRRVWALFVHPDHEARGHGRCILDAMVAWLFAQSDRPIWLSTDPGTRAQRFYEAAGWQATGTTKNGELRYERSSP